MIKIDSNKLKNETKPKINSAISNLNQASSLLTGLQIPDNFYYLSDLKGMPSQINQILKDVKGINTYIDQKTSEFDAARNSRVPIGIGIGVNALNYEQNLTIPKKTGASAVNVCISLVKGFADVGESLVDTAAVVTSVPLTVITVGQDIAQNLKAGKGLLNIDFKNTKELWSGTMSMVAEDTVGNAFNKFYEKTKFGKWLDTNAYTPFKSGGAVTKVAEGIGQIAGVVALTVLTCGAGTGTAGAATAAKAAATKTAVSSAIAGARGFGEGAEHIWSKQRDSSWEGMQSKYQKGEISQETMETYKYIRSMNEKEIYRLYRASKITQEQYKAMLEIKQMPEDWTTGKNALKGLGYALATGGWEAVQYYVGNKLNNFSIKGASAFINAASRVGIDTIFNALDTPFRAGTESLFTRRDFKDIYEELGGTNAVISSALVGMIGSSIGEYVTHRVNKYDPIEANQNKIDIEDLNDEININEGKLAKLMKSLRIKKYEKMLKKSSNGLDEVMKEAVRNGDTEEVYDIIKNETLFTAYMNGYRNGSISEEIKEFKKIRLPETIATLEIKDDSVKKLINNGIEKSIICTDPAVRTIARYAEKTPIEEMEKLMNIIDTDENIEIGLHSTKGGIDGYTIMKEGVLLGDTLYGEKDQNYASISRSVSFVNKDYAIDKLFSGSEGGVYYKNDDLRTCDVIFVSKPKGINDIQMQYVAQDGLKKIKPEYILGFTRINPVNKSLEVYLNNR